MSETICRINQVSVSDLDVSAFPLDEDIPILNKFKKILLSYKDKRFFIVGDYDCDGICATAIISKLFKDLQIASNYYIPSRSKEGYGLNKKIVDTAYEHHFDVLLCVDNGIVANEALSYAKSLGLITLVIDHHEYSKEPECDAYLHPALFDEQYADMCASGLCCLLSQSFRTDELSLVYGGLATLADMVSVLGYNRYLLKKTLALLNERPFPTVSYLTKNKKIDYETLSYDVIPKINAVSRMDDALNVNYVVKYLLSDRAEAAAYLSKIEQINTTRKQLTREMASLAERLCDPSKQIIIVSSEAFKEGLCGLIANRLMNDLGRPVIILSESDGLLKGSGRAPKGFDLYGLLKDESPLFSAFGGHAQAIGLSIEKDKYETFLKDMEDKKIVSEEVFKDVIVYPAEDYDTALIEEMDGLRPFGQGFEEPLFCIDDFTYAKKYMIQGMYPKYTVNEKLEAICFHTALKDRPFSKVIGSIKKDTYRIGRVSFIIEDLV
ncbi:MAG: DHH family phosphoesterase [Erysipelotrichaceae bacterium]|nr:DHH family phosphoesterase [Erysipelotrichaceae bacterium]